MNETDRVRAIITGLQNQYPKIYEAFSALTKAVDKLDENIDTIKSEVESIPETGLAIAPNVLFFTYTFTRRNVILSWVQPDTSIFFYEIRVGGFSWETASHVLTSATLSAVFDPLPVGTTRYWIKGIDFDGNVSVDALFLDVTVPAIGTIIAMSTVIDNNVLLQWTEPTTTFDIDYYTITRDSTLIGKQKGTFAIVFESISGVFIYKLQPVDIAGNIGPESAVLAEVRQPPDFELMAQIIDDLSGTKVNTVIYESRLLCSINLTETWEDHFVNNSWTDIEDQITAGYPIYLQPTEITGSYEQIFDFGGIFDNILINIAWNQNQITGTTSVAPEIATSTDNVTYTSFVAGRSLFATSFRYVKVKFTFTGVSDTSLLEFYNLIINLNIKIETDSGHGFADKDDVGGTTFTFNKAFKDVNSITVTADLNVSGTAVYDFVDIPNPTDFEVLVFDSAGARIDADISWKARGIT